MDVNKEFRTMSMTSKQVVNALIRGEKAERIGLFEHGAWSETMAAWVKQGYPTHLVAKRAGEMRWSPEDGRGIKVTADGEYPEPDNFARHFDHDMIHCGGFPDWLPLRGVNETIEETDEWAIIRNGAGAAFKHWKHQEGTPGPVDFRMTSRAVWERDYRPHLLAFDPDRVYPDGVGVRLWREQEPLLRDKWVFYGGQFIWENMRASMGDEEMYANLLLDPEWIRDYGRVYTDLFKTHMAHLFDKGGLPDGIWIYEDLGYNSGLQASPHVLRELIFPYYAELVAFFRGYGLPTILHADGYIAEAIPLIVEAGFAGLNPIERKNPANDPFAYADKWGDKLLFVGGFDERILETNDRAIIRREITEYLAGMKARGARLLFATDHSISPRVHYETYRYAMEVYRENMGY